MTSALPRIELTAFSKSIPTCRACTSLVSLVALSCFESFFGAMAVMQWGERDDKCARRGGSSRLRRLEPTWLRMQGLN
eukprot:1671916-Heterocapsa_arctica.AAC.1